MKPSPRLCPVSMIGVCPRRGRASGPLVWLVARPRPVPGEPAGPAARGRASALGAPLFVAAVFKKIKIFIIIIQDNTPPPFLSLSSSFVLGPCHPSFSMLHFLPFPTFLSSTPPHSWYPPPPPPRPPPPLFVPFSLPSPPPFLLPTSPFPLPPLPLPPPTLPPPPLLLPSTPPLPLPTPLPPPPPPPPPPPSLPPLPPSFFPPLSPPPPSTLPLSPPPPLFFFFLGPSPPLPPSPPPFAARSRRGQRLDQLADPS